MPAPRVPGREYLKYLFALGRMRLDVDGTL